jgi:hypothetical protein
MKSIVVFGAGKSATCLIDYLTRICTEKNWILTIADADVEALHKKLIPSAFVHAIQVHVEHAQEGCVVGFRDGLASREPAHCVCQNVQLAREIEIGE